MTWQRRPMLSRSAGLLGQLLIILLASVVIEFAADTFFYEQSSAALVRDDEAHRLAEHLVLVRKLISEQEWAARSAMAERVSTDRYSIRWSSGTVPPPASPVMTTLRQRVLDWEPTLADAALSVALVQTEPTPMLVGHLRLVDSTWISFRAKAPVAGSHGAWQRVLVGLLPVTAILLVGALLFRRTLRPLRTLARRVELIGRGAGVTLAEEGPGELRHLIRAFNAMQARIHDLITDRTQALAAVGHDLRTPLARLQLRSDAITDASARRSFHADIAEMESMVGSLLAYLAGEADPEAPVRSDLAVLLATIVDAAADRGAQASYTGPDHLEASIRPGDVKRAVNNLVENALHYGHRARVSLAEDDAVLVIAVEDDGPGIAPDEMAEALRPFGRLDVARARNTGGLGLGLAIVARVAEQAGGRLILVNRSGGGLRAELKIPR